jgi:hypothetical protein
MPTFCISMPRLRSRPRAVIVIVIYLTAFRLAPGDSLPLAVGTVLAGLLAIEPTPDRIREGSR